MITRQDLHQLQSFIKVPALSILLPTHRTSPDNKQDPIRVKNLVDEATERLTKEFSQRELEPLLQRLDALVNEIDYPHTLDGLALYVSHDFAKLYYLPFSVPARVVIDQTFATRDLVYGMHRALRYWVLLLSQASTRLLAGTGETLEEVHDQNFPMQMTGPGATAPLPYEADSSYLDDRHRRFFQQVDSAFTTYAKDETLPLIVGGVDRQISFFQEVSQHAATIAGTLTGNYDRASIPEITPHVWSLMQTVRESHQTGALQELDNAIGAQKIVSTIEEVWRLAQDGRGKRLLVEKNYHVPAIVTEDGRLELVDQPGGTEIMDDAVDEIIEVVLAKGGNVATVDDGALSAQQRIALILRY
uniref:Chemotaxis protein n=1 Tax=Oscillatoriales cyanobacterium SpSt-402 TaxID=2282168 RepID=A0A832GY64_9CYAN